MKCGCISASQVLFTDCSAHMFSTQVAASVASDAPSSARSSASGSHRYIGVKRCRVCKRSSTDDTPFTRRLAERLELWPWLKGKGYEAEGLWCKFCYCVVQDAGYLAEYGTVDLLFKALRENKQLMNEFGESIQSAIQLCQGAGHTRFREKMLSDSKCEVAAARKRVVKAYEDDPFIADDGGDFTNGGTLQTNTPRTIL